MYSVKEFIHLNEENKLILPDFQRSFVWDHEKQKSLISSFMTMLPLGNVLILNGKQTSFAAKQLCYQKGLDFEDSDKDASFLLDGQQRLSTLKSVFYDLFSDDDDWKNPFDDLYNKLKTRWFLNLRPTDSNSDMFGMESLIFRPDKLSKAEPDDLLDYLEIEQIYKTKKTNQWFHPSFKYYNESNEEITGHKFTTFLANQAAEKNLVPLNGIYKSKYNQSRLNNLQKRSLDKIAEKRIEELKDEVSDGSKDIKDLLGHIEPDILELVDEDNDMAINTTWQQLGVQWSNDVNKYLIELLDQKIQTIELPTDEIHRAIAIFENINSNPTALDHFDLIVARAARNKKIDITLTLYIKNLLEEPLSLSDGLTANLKPSNKPVQLNLLNMNVLDNAELNSSVKKYYLNLLSIIAHYINGPDNELKLEHIKKRKQSELDHHQINDNTEITITAFKRALSFFQIRCGIVKISDLPYQLMLIPVAIALLNDSTWESKEKLDKIEYWYWLSLFSGRYREKQNDQCINDTKELNKWIENNQQKNPFSKWYGSILESEGYSSKSVLMYEDDNYTPPSAITTGILQFVLSNQPYDFLSNQNSQVMLNTWEIAESKQIKSNGKTFGLKIEDHHICPLYDATKLNESTKNLRQSNHILNSVFNRTFISSEANSIIRSKSPSSYLNYISGISLRGHLLPDITKYNKSEGESKDEFYKRIVEERYFLVRDAILRRIDSLA